jgi:hypothetical protein
MTAPKSMPAWASTAGFTMTMYAMVRKVVRPPTISPTVVPAARVEEPLEHRLEVAANDHDLEVSRSRCTRTRSNWCDTTSAPSNAEPSPCRVAVEHLATKPSMAALTTHKKSGEHRDRQRQRTINGRTNAFTMPSNSAAMNSVGAP